MRRRVLIAVSAAVLLSACTTEAPPVAPNAQSSSNQPSASRPAPSSDPAPSSSPDAPGSSAPPGALDGELRVTGTVVENLQSPWSMAVLPNGNVLVSERDTAQIRLVRDGTLTDVDTVDGVVPGGEGGLLGIAVADIFAREPYLYAYYTSAEDNRIVRMRYDDGALGEQELLLAGIPKASIHNGGRIKFGPDGLLYAGTGDATLQDQAQDPDSLAGKILRMTPEGEPAPGNPFDQSVVYSIGHRNVQGLGWDSEDRLWASEFGPEVDDELNLVEPGGNYGWPEVTGAPGVAEFIDAQVVWPSTASSSPSGMAVIDDVAYLGGLRGQRLWEVPLNDGAAGEPQSHFRDEYGRLRDVIIGPQDGLWVLTDGGSDQQILRVEGR